MIVDTTTYKELTRPMYVLEEWRLRRNLEIIKGVADSAGIEIILAFKAYVVVSTIIFFF
jgi:carboxynorspermidine decarboxylase